jgi:hypothetical protein
VVTATDEKTVVSGREYHTACYGSNLTSEPRRIFQPTADTCAACRQPIGEEEKIVLKGADYHRRCANVEVTVEGKCVRCRQPAPATGFCSHCGQQQGY